MLTEEIATITQKLNEIEEKFEVDNIEVDEHQDLESEVLKMEREILDHLYIAQGIQFSQLNKLQKRIHRIKEENEFYDEDSTLDMMFPNRDDDDFDEDSMSYDSVFGDD
jgi:tetrahydromethanopterin S-methyltransferase subunit G